MMKKIFLYSVLMFLFSCSDIHKGEYLSDIGKLENRLSDIKDGTSEIDTVALDEMFSEYTIVNTRVKSINDTLDLETALLLDDYLKAMRKIECVRIDLVVVQENVEQEFETLSRLKEDITNAYGKRDKYEEFIKTEELRVDSINEIFEETLNDYESIKEIFVENNNALKERLNTYALTE